MAKNNKNRYDIAKLNKEDYIKSNYTVSSSDEEIAPMSNGRRIIIVSMLTVLLVALVVTAYFMYFVPNDEESSLSAVPTVSPTPETTPSSTSLDIFFNMATPTPRPVLVKYEEYEAMYPDIVGWISIENIKVDYPVVQSPDPSDPFKYLDKGPDQTESKNGSIFLDIRNSIDASDRHTVIYGHNMGSGAMFGQLDKYLSRTFFFNHLIIRYDTLYQELEWEVFNVFMTTTDFYYIQTYFSTDEEFVNLMNQCVSKSYYNDNTTEITAEDRILTLSTCTNEYEDGRLVVQARLITPLAGDETPIPEEEINTPNPSDE